MKNQKPLKELFFIIYFLIIYYINTIIIIHITVIQFISNATTGNTVQSFRKFGSQLALYNSDIVEYLTYKSTVKPWPYNDFPAADSSIKSCNDKEY